MVTGTYIDPGAGRQTFTEYYAEWSARQVWAPGTETAMSLAARSTTFADVRMRSLRRSHVEHWVKSMVTRGLAPGTVHTRTNNVRAVLRGAVADRVIPRDPSEGIALPRRRRAAAAMTLPTPAQVGAILEAADGPFAPSSGCAASPACASARRPPSASATSTPPPHPHRRPPGAARPRRHDRAARTEVRQRAAGLPRPVTGRPARPARRRPFARRAPGSSPGTPVSRRTRTPSAIAGGRRSPRPAWTA